MAIPFDIVLALVAATGPAMSPRQAPRTIALAIARVAEDLHEASTLVVMAKHESDFVPDVAGDCDGVMPGSTPPVGARCHSFGTWQLQRVSRAVACDPFEAAPIALARLRKSATECPAAPLAVYASGRCGGGRQISRSRGREIERLRSHAMGQLVGSVGNRAP